nr:hypothetical protein [Tanacetum cinerariifolium]
IAILMFTPEDDPIACLNKAMAFMSAVAASQFPQPTINLKLPLIRETMPLFKTTGLLCNKFKEGKDKVMLVLEIKESSVDEQLVNTSPQVVHVDG